jgi:tetratricopeptide (TPR) repeat protein
MATDLLPYSIEAKLGLALPLSGLGHWNQVTELYQQILQIDPQNSLVNYRLGSIAYTRNNYEQAFAYLEKVVNQYPMDYDSVILFAWTNYRLSKLRQAKVLFQKALLLKPNDESARQGLQLIL